MSNEKPLGWRPLTEEQRQGYVDLGWSDEQIAEVEKENVYSPVENAVLAFELASAVLFVATKRLGADFALEVRDEISRKAKSYSRSELAEDQVEARILDDFLDRADWERLAERATVSEK